MPAQTALIIGAGPPGLTAASELLDKTSIQPILFEASDHIGGIARTVNHHGNRIDIGGHRFFSKSDRVMEWWLRFMPLQGVDDTNGSAVISYQNKHRSIDATREGPDPEKTDRVMLVRNRLSRILFLRKFFDYPISLNLTTLTNLGPWRIVRIGTDLMRTRLFPIRHERSLEDFLINRFGRELYLTFFKDYTEKVWGVSCDKISPEWGAQRIKGLSLTKALLHAVGSLFKRKRDGGISQKSTETSLIERFLYPKLGPGQLWEYVAETVQQRGGEVHMQHEVVRILHEAGRVTGLEVRDHTTGATRQHTGDYIFSTMPVQDLLRSMGDGVPQEVREVSDGLMYRDFITVGLLLSKLKVRDNRPNASTAPENARSSQAPIPDNWIYIQERDVRVGRLQVFNNWSPYMVKDPNTVWLGLEYFCREGDDLWTMADDVFARFAADELAKIGMIDPRDVLDSVVIRMPKTYPAYFGTYDRFDTVRQYVDGFENLFLVGRNGMHRYNNQDHSMLTAMTAVENIVGDVRTKDNIWNVNVEQEYHEQKS